MEAEEAAGLYIHIPFCAAICPYCDFAVEVARRGDPSRLIESLEREIAFFKDDPLPIDTIYFGGGTPSSLEARLLSAILEAVRAAFNVAGDAWIFLEANPEDVDRASVRAWRDLGVRTLSLGIQSFDRAELRFLGRRHGPERALESIETALAAGFSTVSVDLIYGLPGQELEAWSRTLRTAVERAPHHLSCYQLTVKENTAFGRRLARGKLVELADASQGDFFELTHRDLAAAGYPPYEVSNFSSGAEHRSRHNQKYWHHVPYLGLGPSAHSFRGARRWWNERDFSTYARRLERGERPVSGTEELRPADLALEALMLGLRTTRGIDLAEFEKRYGVDLLGLNTRAVEAGVEAGRMLASHGRLALTRRGLAVADAISVSLDLG